MQWLQRSVGIAIIGAAGLGAGALWVAVASSGPQADDAPSEGVLFGVWQVFYDTAMPDPRVMLAAVGVALLLAAGVAGLDVACSRGRAGARTATGCRWPRSS